MLWKILFVILLNIISFLTRCIIWWYIFSFIYLLENLFTLEWFHKRFIKCCGKNRSWQALITLIQAFKLIMHGREMKQHFSAHLFAAFNEGKIDITELLQVMCVSIALPHVKFTDRTSVILLVHAKFVTYSNTFYAYDESIIEKIFYQKSCKFCTHIE